jgi:hypothetical protein
MFSQGFEKTAAGFIRDQIREGGIARRTLGAVGHHFDRNDMRYIGGAAATGAGVNAYAQMTHPDRKKKSRA